MLPVPGRVGGLVGNCEPTRVASNPNGLEREWRAPAFRGTATSVTFLLGVARRCLSEVGLAR